MKLKFFASVLSIVLLAFCITSCGEKNNTNNSDNDIVTEGEFELSAEVTDGRLNAVVTLKTNPGIAGFNLIIGFDNEKLRPVGFGDADIISHEQLTSNLQWADVKIEEIDKVSAYYVVPNDFTDIGVLLTLTFDILDGASGITELTLDCDNITNQHLQDMKFSVNKCMVALD